MADKVYLGDGAYAEFDGNGIALTAENGICATDRVYLEPEVLVAFERFVAKLRASAAGPPPAQNPTPPAAETIANVRSHLAMLAGVDLALRKACDSYKIDTMKNVQMEKAVGDWAVGTAKAAADFMVLGGGQEVTDAVVMAMRIGIFILARLDRAGCQIVQPGGPVGGDDGTEF